VCLPNTKKISAIFKNKSRRKKDIRFVGKHNKIMSCLLLFDPPAPKSYLFCSDSRFLKKIVPGSGMWMCVSEAHLSGDRKKIAPKQNMPPQGAATIARKLMWGWLILGHFLPY